MFTPPRLSAPVVLVSSSAPRLQMLLVNLQAADFRALDLEKCSDEDKRQAELILLDSLGGSQLTARHSHRSALVASFVKSGTKGKPEGVDFSIDSLSQLAWLRSQVMMRRRTSLRESENALRSETAQAFGRGEGEHPCLNQQHVLIAAAPGPRWLAVTKALQANGVRVSACLTPETLRMRMVEEPVSLVLAERGKKAEFVNAAAMAAADDPRAQCIPLAVWPTSDSEDSRGLGPSVDWTFPASEAPNTVALKCRILGRSGDTVQQGTEPEAHDSVTGLPSRVFFENHLERQIIASRRSGQPMCMATFRLTSGEHTSRVTDLARSLQNSLRAEDMAARLDWQTVAVSLRATDFQDAHAVTERLVHCVSHDGVPASAIQTRVVALRAGQNAQQFIDTATGHREIGRHVKVAV